MSVSSFCSVLAQIITKSRMRQTDIFKFGSWKITQFLHLLYFTFFRKYVKKHSIGQLFSVETFGWAQKSKSDLQCKPNKNGIYFFNCFAVSYLHVFLQYIMARKISRAARNAAWISVCASPASAGRSSSPAVGSESNGDPQAVRKNHKPGSSCLTLLMMFLSVTLPSFLPLSFRLSWE